MPDTPNTLYIPMYLNFLRHRKPKALARTLGVELDVALLLLLRLWAWALEEASAGDLTKYTAEEIADECRWTGDADALIRALVETHLLDQQSERLLIHDWADYGGKVLANRDRNRERQQNFRNRHVTVTKEDRNGDKTVMSPLPNGYIVQNGAVTVTEPLRNRQEESRVEESRGEEIRQTVAGRVTVTPSPTDGAGRSDLEGMILSILAERHDWPRDRGGNTTRELRDIIAKTPGVDHVKCAYALRDAELTKRPANLLTFRKFCEAEVAHLADPPATHSPRNGKAAGPYRDKGATVGASRATYAVDLTKMDKG